MQIDPVKDKFILDTFHSVSVTQLNNYRGKRNWFNSVSLKLSEHGYKPLSVFESTDLVIPKVTKFELKPTVNINNYCILEVNGLYRLSILELFYDDCKWSHPLAMYLLLHFPRLKQALYNDGSDTATGRKAYRSMKVYVNLIPGMLRSYSGEKNPSVLSTNTTHAFESIRSYGNYIVQEILKGLGVTPPSDKIVCVDVDEIVLDMKYEQVQLLISRNLERNKFMKEISFNDDIFALNRICRKLKIDIVK